MQPNETPNDIMNRLAAFEPTGFPVISLYLDTSPNNVGRDDYAPFVRAQFKELERTFAPRSAEQESFERDRERINNYLENELDKSSNGVALFTCAGADFFQAVQLDVPVERHRLSVADYPDIYPLARLQDQYPSYAALVADTNAARIFVFSLGRQVDATEITGTKTNRSQVGGWSQARYQRHVNNIHMHHAKEVIDELERIVREENIQHIILAGDEVVIPILREHLPQQLGDKVVDVLRLDIKTPEHEILRATLERMREQDAEADAEKVKRLINEYRAGGLAVAGLEKTRRALELGQVDELVISAQRDAIKGQPIKEQNVPRAIQTPEVMTTVVASGTPEVAAVAVAISDELVVHAHRTGARVTFIEDPALLTEYGGVGAFLRFKL